MLGLGIHGYFIRLFSIILSMNGLWLFHIILVLPLTILSFYLVRTQMEFLKKYRLKRNSNKQLSHEELYQSARENPVSFLKDLIELAFRMPRIYGQKYEDKDLERLSRKVTSIYIFMLLYPILGVILHIVLTS
jgi:hypothetical protein